MKNLKVFEPLQINTMTIKNRIAFAPFLNMPAAEDDTVSDTTIRWFEERAKGGTGLIVTGALGVLPPMQKRLPGMPSRLTIHDNSFIPGLARLAEAIHKHGTKIVVQIVVGGPMGGLGPSPGPFPDERHPKDDMFTIMNVKIPVHPLTVEEILKIEDAYAAAALRLKKAGIDGVLLHCAHGGATLNCSFISPFYNRREDDYGGSWENRLRLPVESIQKMRQAVGPEYPIFARISADELLGSRGITLDDACKYVAPALEKAGVDCLDVSQGSILHAQEGITIPLYYKRGCYIHNAATVKKVVSIPVMTAGRIVEMDMAEKFLRENNADIVYMGSQLCADTETVKKYWEGRPDDIRICIGCKATQEGQCGRPCVINYDIQDEPIPCTPTEKPKNVVVIGGGVAGMEAAIISAIRGHRVTLLEKESYLGGQVNTLSHEPLLMEFGNIVQYMSGQLKKKGVDVRTCFEATDERVLEMKPDVVILASGSSPNLPAIVKGQPAVISHDRALREKYLIGKRVVVWGFFGAETAISLAEEGKQVVLIGKAGEGSLGSDLPRSRLWWLLRKLTDINFVRESPDARRVDNPEVVYNTNVLEVETGYLRILSKGTGRERTIPFDTLIVSQRFGERKKNDGIFAQLEGKVSEVYKIGDCAQVRSIKEAVWTANEVARKI